MNRPPHGTHDPAKGWYDSGRDAYVSSPDKLTRITEGWEPSDYDRDQYAKSRESKFTPDPQLDRLRRLRESDQPDDRARYERVVAGSKLPLSLAEYERKITAHVAAGGELPDGITPPPAGA